MKLKTILLALSILFFPVLVYGKGPVKYLASLKDSTQQNVNARGSVDAILDEETGKLKVSGSYEYFGTNATGILVQTEGVEDPICSFKPPYNATNSPWKDWGSCDLNLDQKKALNAGKLYILIKTIGREDGQVRGAILPETKK
ncbi:CHRD domain-containing protein [Leptospira sp. 201903070]|jgi:hypothetical protein|uniref:CHRD domain-containing protein n=1 Tax=Leptospira ainlahdjerensis TaxID=2810033 RepID=A0ABS2UBL3_9LEPT|nr:CHRD domain-containing protein [Leptospira ainlahdjerensis]MBM9577674.1 CHRD domain-containing protein [Leptospira ainlahdjerensis]MBM9577746.1 CHRD domain-containing protein [Leptospira ainlahdjerensis]